MKTFRLIGMALIAIVMSVNFTSCSSDDDEENNIVSGKLLRSITRKRNDNYQFNYNEKEQFNYNEKKQLISATTYDDKITVKWSDSDIIVETTSPHFEEEPEDFIIKNGVITSTISDNKTNTLSYDSNKHLIKLSGYMNCSWIWENGNISKFSHDNGETISSYTCTYYTDKENKHSTIDINALRLYYISGIGEGELLLMAHPNLLGTTNKNLLKSVTRNDGWSRNYTYEFDSEGYPIKIIETITDNYGSNDSTTYMLIWQ